MFNKIGTRTKLPDLCPVTLPRTWSHYYLSSTHRRLVHEGVEQSQLRNWCATPKTDDEDPCRAGLQAIQYVKCNSENPGRWFEVLSGGASSPLELRSPSYPQIEYHIGHRLILHVAPKFLVNTTTSPPPPFANLEYPCTIQALISSHPWSPFPKLLPRQSCYSSLPSSGSLYHAYRGRYG